MLMKPSLLRQRGFSMIEIAVTLTVIVLLLAAVGPSVGDWMRNTRVRNAADSIQNGLQKARTEALRTNETVTFWLVSGPDERIVDDNCRLSSTSGSWVVSRNDPTGACSTAPSATVVPMIVDTHAAGDGASGVSVAAADADGNASQCVRFNGFGRVVDASSAPADGCRQPSQLSTIDLTHVSGARRLRVVVSPGGGVRMCDRDVAAGDPRACP
jgi:type IV fimbrial biogenesis protein FimT